MCVLAESGRWARARLGREHLLDVNLLYSGYARARDITTDTNNYDRQFDIQS